MDIIMKLVLFLLLVLISSALGQDECWRGSKCEGCQDSVKGSINGEDVCCANCEESGFAMAPNSCTCQHNGSGKSMYKPGYLNGSEAIRGSSACAYSSVALVAMLLKSTF